MKSQPCILLILALTFGWYTFGVHTMTIVDDVDPSIRYANTAPAWIGGTVRTGGTPHNRHVNGPNQNYISYQATWHEALGDGAAVQFAFTGTRIRVNATVAITGYPLRVQFYMDNNPLTTYTNEVPAPLPSSAYDWRAKTTILDQDALAPAQHTLRMVTVGNDSLFLLDAIEFEASEALVTLPTGSSGSSPTSAVSPSTSTTTGTITQTATELNTTSTISNGNSTNVGAATREVITITSTSGASGTVVGNPNILSSSSAPSPGTIAGAIVGGLAGLSFIVLLGLFLLQRHREKKHAMVDDSDDETGATGIPSDETADGMVAGSGMSQTSWAVPLSHDHGRYPAHEPAASGDPFRGPTSGAMPVSLVRGHGTGEGDEDSNPSNGGQGQDVDDAGSMTYQTLPSYRERILEAQSQIQASNSEDGAARMLSQADINAISQRLTEVMRVYIQQIGGDPGALDSRVIVPPRELIDHLVEERLNPREEHR